MSFRTPLPPPMYKPTDQGSVKAFKHYRDILKEKGVEAKDHTKINNGDTTSLEHLLWMCEHCIPQIRDDGMGFAVGKYSRWLGYVQGCLICKGVTTVEAERNRTRPWFTGKD